MPLTSSSVQPLAPAEVEALVHAAIHAPSADNRHVFVWRNTDNELQLGRRASRVGALHHQDVLDELSLGGVAMNIELQAGALGLCLDSEWFTEGSEPETLLVRYRCTQRAAPRPDDVSLARAIPMRHTNRALRFGTTALSRSALDTLSAEVTAEGCVQHWLDTASARQATLKAMRLAETARFANRALHDELFSAIQWRQTGQPAGASEGLPMQVLGLSAFEQFSFPLLRHWSIQRSGNLFGLHHALALRSVYLPCRWAPHLGAISCAPDTLHPAFQVGRALQRLWLRATALGLSLQVLAAAPVYVNTLPGTVDLSLIRQLRQCWEIACQGAVPWIAFRLGQAAPPTARTGRPTIATLAWPEASG